MKDDFPIVGALVIMLAGARTPGYRRATEYAAPICRPEHPITVGALGVGNVLEGTLV